MSPSDDNTTVYRSKPALYTGGLLLAVEVWLVVDTLVRGHGRTVWVTLAGLLLAAVAVTAFTLRGAVFAGPERLVVRNPFRSVTVPWGRIDEIRAEYSVEVRAGGRGYHLWSVPVSIRERKRAARATTRHSAENPFGRATPTVADAAFADQVVADLRGMVDQFADSSTGDVQVAWSWEVLGGLAVGAVLLVLAVLL